MSMWPEELELLDMTIKQYVEPSLMLNRGVLDKRLRTVRAEKEALIRESGLTKEQLMSTDKLAEALKEAGVPADRMPIKHNVKNLPIYAFAKTDPDFLNLKGEFNGAVDSIVDARLAAKSTLEETRIERFLSLDGENGILRSTETPLRVPLLYYGAHTGRFSGWDKLNLQNLGRGGALREAIVAPPEHKIIAADLAQIEARLTACFCKQWDLVEQFASGVDVYADFASGHYGYPVNADDHPKERFVGKTAILSLGYQSGNERFFRTMNDVFHTPISFDEAAEVVHTYRRKYRKISNTWYELNDGIRAMRRGTQLEWGCVTFEKESVRLPNGMRLNYPDITEVENTIYGGKLLENIIQALARIVMTTAAIRLYRHNLRPALSVHDELVYCVKENNVELVSMVVKSVMEQAVSWMPELPVKCEAKIGDSYVECK